MCCKAPALVAENRNIFCQKSQSIWFVFSKKISILAWLMVFSQQKGKWRSYPMDNTHFIKHEINWLCCLFCPPALVLPNDSLMVVGADHKTPTMMTEKFCLDVYFLWSASWRRGKKDEAVKYRQCHLYVVMIIRAEGLACWYSLGKVAIAITYKSLWLWSKATQHNFIT